jgi:Tfp pilus assembly protein PilE
VAVVLPVPAAPRDGTPSYNLAVVTANNPPSFTLTATPVAGGRMDGDPCGAFTLNNFGQRDLDADLDGAPEGDLALIDTCWGR